MGGSRPVECFFIGYNPQNHFERMVSSPARALAALSMSSSPDCFVPSDTPSFGLEFQQGRAKLDGSWPKGDQISQKS
jgi:hypothetical protein